VIEEALTNGKEGFEFHFDNEKVMEFEKLFARSSNHLRALDINANINGHPVSKEIVDGGPTLTLVQYFL